MRLSMVTVLAKPSICIVLSLSIAAYNCFAQTDVTLASLQWQHRLLLINADTPNSAHAFIERLQQDDADIIDRDIVWYVVYDQTLTHNHASYGYTPAATELRLSISARLLAHPCEDLMLIGKDGGVKICAEVLDLKRLFNTIDAMPMRIREMEK